MTEPVVRQWVWDTAREVGVLTVDNRGIKQTKKDEAATKRRADGAQAITYEQWLRRPGNRR